MFTFIKIGFALIIWWAQSAYGKDIKTDSKLVYDARLSSYQYDFDVNFFAIKSQRQSLTMDYINKGDRFILITKKNQPS